MKNETYTAFTSLKFDQVPVAAYSNIPSWNKS